MSEKTRCGNAVNGWIGELFHRDNVDRTVGRLIGEL
jgi:hypothetical protein